MGNLVSVSLVLEVGFNHSRECDEIACFNLNYYKKTNIISI